jgi:phage-related protein
MEIFDFPHFLYQTQEQDNSTRVKFGDGYEFAAAPSSPFRGEFELKFGTMQWYLNKGDDGQYVPGSYDVTTDKDHNLSRLREFYRAHGLWRRFILPHPVFGDTVVRFSKAPKWPYGLPGGQGWTEPLTLTLIECP